VRWLALALVLAGCAPTAEPEEPTVDARVAAVADAAPPDAAVAFEPRAGVYDETMTLMNDSCGTQWVSPKTFVTVVQITPTTITFTNSGGTATYNRTGAMSFAASIGMSTNMGMWTSVASYEITMVFSYTDAGRSCQAVFHMLGIGRP